MTKVKQQEMLDVLTKMSAVAKQILRENKVETKATSDEVQKLLAELKAACAAE